MLATVEFMILGFANAKGGVGKSTLAKNLLVYLHDRGHRVALVDAEKHGPTAKLLKQYDGDLEVRSAFLLDEIDDAVQELVESGYHVIIDAPGKEGDQVSSLCLLSDLVIIPLCLSEQDILQTIPVIKLVRRQRERSRDGKPDSVVVFTRTTKNDAVAPIVRSRFEPLGIPVAKTEIRSLKPIERCTSVMRNGRFLRPGGCAVDMERLFLEMVVPRLEPISRVGNA